MRHAMTGVARWQFRLSRVTNALLHSLVLSFPFIAFQRMLRSMPPRTNRWRPRDAQPPQPEAGQQKDAELGAGSAPTRAAATSSTRAQMSRVPERRNYDPANYPASTPTTQEFVFGTSKWQSPSVPIGFTISDDLKLDAYITDGTFGRCFHVSTLPASGKWPKAKEGLVAKIMRPIAKHNQYIGDATIEACYLTQLMSHESCPSSIVKFYGSVIFPDPQNADKRFHALIFEACAASLHAFWQDYARRQSWHNDDIRSIAFQLLQCCAFLHGLGFVHTDIKHKNIMLKTAALRSDSRRPLDASVRVIDFGNMTHTEDYHTQPIGTRQFRAPEIQLGLEWDDKCDLWGCGCVLHWMHESRTVFEPYSEADQLQLMEELVGRSLPQKLIARSKRQHLFEGGELKQRHGKTCSSKGVGKKGKKGGGKGSVSVVPISEGVKDPGLQGLLLDLLELDPLDRLPAGTLLTKYDSYFREGVLS
ncbi:unnamed protein product [Prorocentrum cordatum]|uniref:Protein kinase domain-containing protein n=1 Tax=Prorocentrum cordatum TaxID=2364126 RepID=A0ABN9VVA2_9DINO|nr:unnamed protein product [Polarella glacialis]